MRSFIRVVQLLVLLATLVACHQTALALPVARLKNVKAPVEVLSSGTRDYRSVQEKAGLSYGDTVRAGAGGKADILFNNGTQVALRPGSQIEIVRPNKKSDPLIIRLFGALSEIFVRPKGPTEIRTRAANAAARGTEYLVRLTAEDITEVTVIEGSVDFYNSQGSVLVQAAQQSRARVGSAPEPPVVVDVTGLIAWTAEITGLSVPFETPFISPDPAVLGPLQSTREAAVRAAPDDATARVRLGEVYYDQSKYSLAAREFRTAGEQEPPNSAAHFGLGQALRGQGDIPGAIGSYQRALELTPNWPLPRYGMALAHFAAGEVTAARNALEPVQENSQAQALLGFLALGSGQSEVAVEHLEQALAGENDDLYQVLSTLALARLAQNELEAALTAARAAVAAQPNSAQTQSALAMVSFFAGEIKEAENAAEVAVQLNPFSSFALLTRGRVLLSQLKTDAAREAFLQAQALAPDLPIVHRELGAVYLRLDMPQRAEEAFRDAIRLDPRSADALTGLGLVLQRRGHTAAALDSHRAALELEPQNTSARANLAELLIEEGRLDEATTELETAVDADPQRGILFVRLSEISLMRQDLYAARQYAQRAVGLLPSSAPAHYQLGRVYLEQGHAVQAEQHFQQALTLDRRFVRARYALGFARDLNETAHSLSPRPSTVVRPSNIDAATGALNLQELQSPGARYRIQAALIDPTAARSASRSYGDFQIDGLVGEDKMRNYQFSYLAQTDNRRGLRGLTAERRQTHGLFPNADTQTDRVGILFGQKFRNSLSAIFAMAQYESLEEGLNRGNVSAFSVGVRERVRKPILLVGGNWQTRERSQTRALIQYIAPSVRATGFLNDSFLTGDIHSLNAEVRHDHRFNDRHFLSAGLSAGSIKRQTDNFFGPIPGLPIPAQRFLATSDNQVISGYIRDEVDTGRYSRVIAELQVRRMDMENTSQSLLPVSPPSKDRSLASTQILPKVIFSYRFDERRGIRVRARRMVGEARHFYYLSPEEIFLTGTDALPGPAFIGGRGHSLELEYDHTFRDASIFRIRAFAQKLTNAQEPSLSDSGAVLRNVRLRGVNVAYEGALNSAATYFIRLNLNDTGDRILNQRVAFVPGLSGEAGLLYLNRKGWFLQPSAYLQSSAFTSGANRTRRGGFGLINLRVGRRSGTRSAVFVEVANILDKSYEVFATPQHGRQWRAGVSHRF